MVQIKTSELRNKTTADLVTMLTEVRKEAQDLLMKQGKASSKDTNLVRKRRRGIAQLLTVLHEKEIIEEGAVGQGTIASQGDKDDPR